MESKPFRFWIAVLLLSFCHTALSETREGLVRDGNASLILQEESRPLYRQVPDAEISLPQDQKLWLSEMWDEKPLLITLFYKNCVGACSPFLRSLKEAVDEAGGLGTDYRIVSLSFDPSDTVEQINEFSHTLGITENDQWFFGTAAPDDIHRIAEAVGFWYKLESKTGQYDHPTLVAAVRAGKIIRVLLGSTVSEPRFKEMVGELKGRFIPFYTRPGEKTIFRCLQVNEATQQVSLNWGLLILILPGASAIGIAVFMFGRIRN